MKTDEPLEGYGILEHRNEKVGGGSQGVKKGGGKKVIFLLSSLLRGWMPSPPQLYELSSGESYEEVSLGSNKTWWLKSTPPSTSVTTHFSQCSFIIPHCDARGNPYYVYLGDR
jgi:hypothetical protein